MKLNSYQIAAGNRGRALNGRSSGFSLIELLIVFVIIGVLTVISIPYLFNYQKRYRPDDQAIRIMDLLRETNQLALTRRRTFRFEIDVTDDRMRIIDGNGTATPDDDREWKAIPLMAPGELRVDQRPNGVEAPNLPNSFNDADYEMVNGRNIWAIGFRSDGSVINANGDPVSANLYVWEPQTIGSDDPKDKQLIRAITLFSGSGAVRFWKHDGVAFVPY